MNLIHLLYLSTGAIVAVLLELFVLTSLREEQLRAAVLSSTAFILFALLWFGTYFIIHPPDFILISGPVIIAVCLLLFYLPLGSGKKLHIGKQERRVDERDVIFSREEYTPGSDKYEQYYSTRPEYKDIDDRMRKLPELLAPGGKYYHPQRSPYTDAVFETIRSLTTKVDGDISPNQITLDADSTTRLIKEVVLAAGASEVGIARLNPMYVYSHVGRGPEKWGQPIENNHRFAIVFTLEMDYEQVSDAPRLGITEESALQYLRGAQISIALARYIRSLGYPARAHISGSNYQIMLPPVAHDAGLGELGRIGYLISPKYGPRIRLGAVTTDLPLTPDRPISFGVQNFCEKCLKCAANCPSAAIPSDNKTSIRGVDKWQLDIEKCLHYWRAIGTDCGLCMKVCPYSHPPTFVHNLVRYGIRRSPFARTLSVWGDNLLYGKKIRY
ncbi:MAG: reductive dehalogenase [Candidatus Zixiibacteriota bacterium]